MCANCLKVYKYPLITLYLLENFVRSPKRDLIVIKNILSTLITYKISKILLERLIGYAFPGTPINLDLQSMLVDRELFLSR